jgi:hypothetical protein
LARLTPHESDDTDIILLSHSMGGLVASDVELLPATAPRAGHTFRHRIIGTINFDVPFLGMHPGVVGSGLGSIFRPAAQPAESSYDPNNDTLSTASGLTADSQSSLQSIGSGPSARHDTLFSSPTDPNFNPQFANDVILPVRKGWKNAIHFINKHSDHLRKATKQLVKSHVEFGGAMTDYPALKLRYMKVRALEDEDTTVRKRLSHQTQTPARVRFVNYYTASTGRSKKDRSRSRSRSRSPYGQHLDSTTSLGTSLFHRNASASSLSSRSISPSPRISLEEHVDGSVVHKDNIDPRSELSLFNEENPMIVKSDLNDKAGSTIESITTDSSGSVGHQEDEQLISNFHVQMPNLPPLPPPPTKPPPLDLTPYLDKEVRKLVRREYDRQVRAYEQALKDREASIKDRQRLEEKLRRLAAKELSKKQEEENKITVEETEANETAAKIGQSTESELLSETKSLDQATAKVQHAAEGGYSTAMPSLSVDSSSHGLASVISHDGQPSPATESSSAPGEGSKKRKDRKFCVLPQKINGQRDPLWVRVYMEGHDEVSAHCGLFFMSKTYEQLVGDVGSRIEEWVRDDMTRRMIDDYAS